MPPELAQTLAISLNRALKSRDTLSSKDILDRLKTADPLSLTTRGLELEYLVIIGDKTKAKPLGIQLVQMFPDSSRIHYLAGRAFYLNQEYPKALECFIESHKIHPHRASRHWWARTLTQMARFTEAEAMLVELLVLDPAVHRDLGWLYERQREFDHALKHYRQFLEVNPGNAFIRERIVKLQAMTADREDVMAEVEALTAMGENVPENLLPVVAQKLLESADLERLKDFFAKNESALCSRNGVETAWVCYRFKAFDLAFDVFRKNLAANLANFMFLNALEKCAGECARKSELALAFEKYAPEQPSLYGRIKRLKG